MLKAGREKALFAIVFLFPVFLHAQICGTSGIDGPTSNVSPVNTYFPIPVDNDIDIPIGSKSIRLDGVPPDDINYGNSYGNLSIRPGDLILIIQMQDAIISTTDNARYGQNSLTSGPDNLGGTGYTSLGFSGKFEYVIATSTVPLTGGVLTFKGAAANGGTINAYNNSKATAIRGQRRFQIVRVPQYSNLVLTANVTTPPYNGRAGGVIAFDVSGDMSFNGFRIDASQRGFRGGYGPGAASGANVNYVYVAASTDTRSVGKGEGIAGTPRYMYDGFNQVDNGSEGLPGGSFGRGAPANAGGGGNDHNAGGGGGGNGGAGGVGGIGWEGDNSGTASTRTPNGGRPGVGFTSDVTRLIMGGGGGGGDANNVANDSSKPNSGVKGGVGGGIILVNVERIVGNGVFLADGGAGQAGIFGSSPDGAGGGGAGGTILVRAVAQSTTAVLTFSANGGAGGNTENDKSANQWSKSEHGPGGGGGGGVIYYNVPGATIASTSVIGGAAGKTDSGKGIQHGSAGGKPGFVVKFANNDLPEHLKGGGQICYPELVTTLTEDNPGLPGSRNTGDLANYKLTVTNFNGGGNAGGVQAEITLPDGFDIIAVRAVSTGGAAGPEAPIFNKVGNTYFIGSSVAAEGFNIPPAGKIVFEITVRIAESVAGGMYHASAMVTYFDPTRTIANPNRRITAKTNAFAGKNTSYETGIGGVVTGSNYNGDLAASILENVHVNSKPVPTDFEVDVIECVVNVAGTLQATDADAAHVRSSLSFTIEGDYDTSKGSFTLNSNGSFNFIPATRLFGTIRIKFRVTDPVNGFNVGELVINQPKPLIQVNGLVNNITAFGANDGKITLSSSGGVGVHSYKWLYPDLSNATTANLSGLAPGIYTVTVTDVNGCTHTESFELKQPPLISLFPIQPVCVDEREAFLVFSDPEVNPVSYTINWDAVAHNAGFVDVDESALPAIVSPANTAQITLNVPVTASPKIYYGSITVKNAKGDLSAPLSFRVQVNPYPLKAIIQITP